MTEILGTRIKVDENKFIKALPTKNFQKRYSTNVKQGLDCPVLLELRLIWNEHTRFRCFPPALHE